MDKIRALDTPSEPILPAAHRLRLPPTGKHPASRQPTQSKLPRSTSPSSHPDTHNLLPVAHQHPPPPLLPSIPDTMPFRQRVARRLGDAVSRDSHSDTLIPQQTAMPLMSDKENQGEKEKKRKRSRDITGKSAQSGKGAVKAAPKRTKQNGNVLAQPSASKVTKHTSGVGANAPKNTLKKKIYQRVARNTRSSSRLTRQLSPDSKPYLSCKSFTPPLYHFGLG